MHAPGVSSELEKAMTPQRDSAPYDGLKPTSPVYEAGNRTLPPGNNAATLSSPSNLSELRQHSTRACVCADGSECAAGEDSDGAATAASPR